MKTIIIRTIPHDNQRYPTVGDYEEFPDRIEFRISNLGDTRMEMALALHELVEFALCKERGVQLSDIDAFDIEYEKNRQAGDESEPGDAFMCPYREEHRFAENIERLFAFEVGLDWFSYDQIVRTLGYDDRIEGSVSARPSAQKGKMADQPTGGMGVGGRTTR